MKKKGILVVLSLFILCLGGSLTLFKTSEKTRILVGSPVRQKPAILREFLASLERLDRSSYTTDYFFVDDNVDEESRELLLAFAKKEGKKCLVLSALGELKVLQYDCNEHTHSWNNEIIWKVAGFKDKMIAYAKKKQYDYLFLIDSDIVLHPKTIDQLMLADKDIISNVFWTNWTPEGLLLPQVWVEDSNTQYRQAEGENLSNEERWGRFISFLIETRTPGTYELGGLGACTLINKRSLQKEISFQKVKNISYMGEDRHFCIRAAALGLGLYVDTHLPSYHIYRESALSGVEGFIRSCEKSTDPNRKQRVTLSMIVKNEADRYLRRVLESAKPYITDAVIIDDGSSDNSVAVCREALEGIPLVIVQNKISQFSNEINLRKQQWEETIKTNPDWILLLDADEIFETRMEKEIGELIKAPDVDAYYFRLYDFWDEEHYREDPYWNAHHNSAPFLVRYRADVPHMWYRETAQHCGRFPSTVWKFLKRDVSIRLKHYGWAKKEDREAKYQRYQMLDPEAKFGIKEQYDSILDENPTLIKWVE